MLFQEKEKQIFDFSVASEFTQIRCKALSVKTQLLWQRLCALRGFCSCFMRRRSPAYLPLAAGIASE